MNEKKLLRQKYFDIRFVKKYPTKNFEAYFQWGFQGFKFNVDNIKKMHCDSHGLSYIVEYISLSAKSGIAR
mgnify:CR=1 FL=1